MQEKITRKELLVAFAGNPNVGKSTLFNALTGMRQHTGNWAGKTVANACGRYRKNGCSWLVTDLPGCCSLTTGTAEEKIARDFIFFEKPDVIVVVCSAVCLERSLLLALQTLEITDRVVVCVNLLDEAARKGIKPDLKLLENRLGVLVVGTAARSGKGLEELTTAVERTAERKVFQSKNPITYPVAVESAVSRLLPDAKKVCPDFCTARWLALRCLDNVLVREKTEGRLNGSAAETERFWRRREECMETLGRQGMDCEAICDAVFQAAADAAERVCKGIVPRADAAYGETDRRLDKILTGRFTGYASMILLLAVVLWITLEGANYLSAWLALLFGNVEQWIYTVMSTVGFSPFICGVVACGAFRVLGWVTAVMLPPMAIFFPLFTLLEDAGYLPRAAFCLDGAFRRAGACGKQSITMCMGMGCNAAGVVGCRIIASPRERLVAVLTNSLMPCNGRFPAMLTMIGLFISDSAGSMWTAVILAGFITLSVAATLIVSRLLTCTVLKGHASSFALEMPPFRRPQAGRTLVRSLVDRTLKVLGRAAVVAFPAGAIIWLLANVFVGGESLLGYMTAVLDPLGRIMGLDGVALSAFILGFPANELVLPIAAMGYSAQGELVETGSMQTLSLLLTEAGWSWKTAVSMILFTMMHWPCSTTCLTIYKETGSVRWTLLAIVLPALCGFLCCTAFNAAMILLGC